MLKFNDWLLERTHEEIDKETEEATKEYEKTSEYEKETEKLKNELLKKLFQEIEWPIPVLDTSRDFNHIYFKTEGVVSYGNAVNLQMQIPWQEMKDAETWKNAIKFELDISTHRVNFSTDDVIDREKFKAAGKLVSFIENNVDKIREIHAKAREFVIGRKAGNSSWEHEDRIRKLKEEKEKLSTDEILSKIKKKEIYEVEDFKWEIHNSRRGKKSRFYSTDGFFKIEIVGWKPKIDPTEYIVNLTRHRYKKDDKYDKYYEEQLGSDFYEKYVETHKVVITRRQMVELAKMFLPEFRGARVTKNII